MPDTTFASRLRYLAAADVDDTVVDYDGLAVVGADGEGLGEVQGFIVDAPATRLLYVVVDSGGWFRSRRVLIPVGHASLSPDRGALRLDVTRRALTRYPEFHEDSFREFSDEDMKLFERQIADACCPDDPAPERYGSLRHYTQPDWWTSSPYAHERLRPVDTSAYGSIPRSPTREHSGGQASADAADDAGDVSPHAGGRAQPGDVLGVETGGERTRVGDTADDENRRRRVAERLGNYDDEPGWSER
jgi:hypothetical protein